MSFPDKKYSVLYCDPPWAYEQIMQNKGRESGSAKKHYSTMSIEELKALDVKTLAEKNCILFMWAASPHLETAIALGKAWGFKYKTVAFVWDKQRLIPGHYTISQCEVCLVFTKGTIPKERASRVERQFLSESKSKRHSEKPHEIRDRITNMFPTHSKLELFSRHVTPGWDVWGDDAALIPDHNIMYITPVSDDLQGSIDHFDHDLDHDLDLI